MKYEDIELSGSLEISGSFQVPYGISGSQESSPSSGSLFFNTTDEKLYVFEGEWEIVGTQIPTIPTPSSDIEYLVVAGGGGGGFDQGGGGGGGGYSSSSLSSIESGSSITITVGAGGSGWTDTNNRNVAAASGTDSSIASTAGTSFSTITSIGGGGGGSGQNIDGRDGGSGGGCSSDGTYNTTGGASTAGQGFDGGDIGTASNRGGGGGGGASAVGQDSDGASDGGDGGDGKQSSITGTATYYAGGGGGGARGSGYNAGVGGSGGGGTGGIGIPDQAGDNGTVNTGGGAGGGSGNGPGAGGDGGSGVVILAYPSSSVNAAGGITGDAGNGRKYHQFNESGTFKVGSTSDFGIVTDNLQVHLDTGNFNSRGTSTWTDLQGNYNATINGPTLGNNYYYDFDGSNDYMTLSTGINLFNTNFTVEAWVDLDADGDENTILEITDNGTYPNHNTVVISAGWNNPYSARFLLRNYTSHQTNIETSGTRTKNQWFHLVYTYDGTTAKIYEDGSLYDSAAFSGFTTNSVGSVSAVNIGVSAGDRYINAQIGQFRLYYDALTADEVLQNYNATKTNFI